MSGVFDNLGQEKAMELYLKFRQSGFSEDDAWIEVYSIECSLD